MPASSRARPSAPTPSRSDPATAAGKRRTRPEHTGANRSHAVQRISRSSCSPRLLHHRRHSRVARLHVPLSAARPQLQLRQYAAHAAGSGSPCRIVATPSGSSRPRGLMASLPSKAEGLEASTTDQASPALGRSGRRTDACHSAAPLELRSPRLGCCVRTSSANGARERAAVKRSAASYASLCASSSTH